jgi:aldehyde dehydrogenase (NAD+)
MSAHPGIDKISFTVRWPPASGSWRGAGTLKPSPNWAATTLRSCSTTSMCDDRAETVFFAAFVNSGQVCSGDQRIYVHAKIHDALRGAGGGGAQGEGRHGLDPTTQFGLIQNRRQYERVPASSGHPATARSRGGTAGLGYFLPPTIVAVSPRTAGWFREQFGPIVRC